jgi:hypothetical protein
MFENLNYQALIQCVLIKSLTHERNERQITTPISLTQPSPDSFTALVCKARNQVRGCYDTAKEEVRVN